MNLRMPDLEAHVKEAVEKNAKYFAIVVSIHGNKETLINETANAKPKVDYYKVAYSDDLIHKNSEGIRIVGYTYGNTFHEIEVNLFVKGAQA